MSFNNIQGTSGQSFSSWASLASGKTVEKEAEEREEKTKAQFASTWGSASGVRNLTTNLANAGRGQKPLRRRTHVGAQAPREDRWDRLARKYLAGIESKEFDVFPYHNDSYRREGVRAEKEKSKDESKAFSKASKSKMSWGEFQEVGSSVERAGEKHVKKIENKDFHYLPVKEIFDNYRNTKLVKANYDDNYSYYIPCKVTKLSPGSKSVKGILEVTLDKDTGKPHHVFFKTVWIGKNTQKFLSDRYGENEGTTISETLKDIDEERSAIFSVQNSKCRVDLIRV